MEAGTAVLFERRGVAGVITLNRPQALNALTFSMVRALHRQLKCWAKDPSVALVIIRGAGEKAFCAGGDVRALYALGRAGDPAFLDFYREEYRLNAFIKHFPKPYVSLLDGITMGGGVGISIHGSHRIATERLVFAMPETGIGLFPDVGGSYFLPRCPGETGMYLGLTGARLDAAGALAVGLATHAMRSSALSDVVARLAEGEDIDTVLAETGQAPGVAAIDAERDGIDRHFGAPSVEAIMASLHGEQNAWARSVRARLDQKSPTSLKITQRQIREGAMLDFDDCMRMEFRLVSRIFAAPDFYEGVRALIIDKDQAPAWQPNSLCQVSAAMVEGYFEPLTKALTFADD